MPSPPRNIHLFYYRPHHRTAPIKHIRDQGVIRPRHALFSYPLRPCQCRSRRDTAASGRAINLLVGEEAQSSLGAYGPQVQEHPTGRRRP